MGSPVPDSDPSSRGTDAATTTPPGPAAIRAALIGVEGGLVATAVMTAYRLPVFRALPPTAEFWAEYVGAGSADRYPLQGLLLHFLYGAVAGGVFGLVFDRVGFEGDRTRRYGGLGLGLGYGLLLSLFGTRVVFPVLLDEDVNPDERLVFHVGHVVYGLSLGTWLSSRESFGEVYD